VKTEPRPAALGGFVGVRNVVFLVFCDFWNVFSVLWKWCWVFIWLFFVFPFLPFPAFMWLSHASSHKGMKVKRMHFHAFWRVIGHYIIYFTILIFPICLISVVNHNFNCDGATASLMQFRLLPPGWGMVSQQVKAQTVRHHTVITIDKAIDIDTL